MVEEELDGRVVVVAHDAAVVRQVLDRVGVVVAVPVTGPEDLELGPFVVALASGPQSFGVDAVGGADILSVSTVTAVGWRGGQVDTPNYRPFDRGV